MKKNINILEITLKIAVQLEKLEVSDYVILTDAYPFTWKVRDSA